MSDSIVSAAHLRTMFDRLNALDNLTLLEMALSHGYQDHQAVAIVKAYRALVSDVPPVPPLDNQPVRWLGIVGASSVPTALWPYLLLAHCFNIPVKIKLPGSDLPSVNLLKDIIAHVSLTIDTIPKGCFESSWDVSTQAGGVLLGAGFWDECDRILVFGSDATVELYHSHFAEPGRVIGFGHVNSVLLVDFASLQSDDRWMDDLLAFGHVGCLAPRLVVAADDASPASVAQLMLSKLNGLVVPDVQRAVTLRNVFHELRVSGEDAWLSTDAMWLISSSNELAMVANPGHLRIIPKSSAIGTGCSIGALSKPAAACLVSDQLAEFYAEATWICEWGRAQYPSMLWQNGGVAITTTVCRLSV
jgi:hypothetical protein